MAGVTWVTGLHRGEMGGGGLVLQDTYHMNIEENSMEQAVATAGQHLGWDPTGEVAWESVNVLRRDVHFLSLICGVLGSSVGI